YKISDWYRENFNREFSHRYRVVHHYFRRFSNVHHRRQSRTNRNPIVFTRLKKRSNRDCGDGITGHHRKLLLCFLLTILWVKLTNLMKIRPATFSEFTLQRTCDSEPLIIRRSNIYLLFTNLRDHFSHLHFRWRILLKRLEHLGVIINNDTAA